ncbi:MAG: nuclear transport factor 2 family protein [Actinomycetota bacterium]
MADIRSTIDAYCESFSANDREGWLACWADDATMEDPVGSPIKQGKAEIGAFYDQGHSMAPEGLVLELTAEPVIVGDEAAIPMRVIVSMGGAQLTTPIVDVMRFDADAKIAAQRAFVDLSKLAPLTG